MKTQRGDRRAPWSTSFNVNGRLNPRARRALGAARIGVTLLALTASPLLGAAQIMISGNEAKIDLTPGAPTWIPNAPPDSLTVLDFAAFPPSVRQVEDVSNSVIGPPSNIAITPDGRLALIADSLKADPADPTKWVPHNAVHIVDLTVDPPAVVGQAKAGAQPSGLSVTPDGKLALVANRAGGTLSVLSIAGRTVREVQVVEVCEPELSVSDVAIGPDGKTALASVQKGSYLAVLRIEGGKVSLTERKISVYGQPYRCVISSDGRFGLTAGAGFGTGGIDADALSVIDLQAEPMAAVDHIALGSGPESIEISPDGNLVAAVLMAGSNLSPDDPNRTEFGEVTLLARKGNTFKKVQTLPTGPIPEGVAFTADGRYLVVQSHPARELWVYRVRWNRLKDTGHRIKVPGMPSSLRAAY